MHACEVVSRDADAMLYSNSSSRSPLVIIAKMKHHFYGRGDILVGDVQTHDREELDPYGLK